MKDKFITNKIYIIQKEDIPLPNQNEKLEFYSPDILEEQKNNNEIDSDIQLKNIINIHHKNLNDYKLKDICKLVYSEEKMSDNLNISYETLIDMLYIKEPYNKNNSNNFIWKNYDNNNEIFFSSNFESGNLRYAIKHNSNEYDLILRPETGCMRNYQWFYFMIKINDNSTNLNLLKENPIIKLNIINLCKNKIIFNNKTRILCYYNGEWSRDTSNVFYYQNDIPYLINNIYNSTNILHDYNSENNNNTNNVNTYNSNQNNKSLCYHTLTFSFDLSKITTNPKYIYFSYCYPYTYTQLTTFLSSLNIYKNLVRVVQIGESLNGVKIHMLIITNFNDSFNSLANKKAIIFTGRVHPGESNSSYVIQGLIEFLVSNQAKAENLRKHFIFKIIPMLNPDGVIHGNFRMNSIGKDLNRMWTEENIENSPSIYFCHQMIKKTLDCREIYFFCDFHGHSNKHNFFLYSCKSKSEFIKIGNNCEIPNPNKKKLTHYELIFQEIFSKENIFFDKNSCINKILPSKIKTARAILKNKYNIDFSYCLETSLGSMKASNGNIIPFSIEQYKKVGRDFGISLNKLNNPKIYYMTYNSVRVNEKKISFMKYLNYKKMKGKNLLLPMINPNNGLPYNYFNKISKGINSINNNENNINNKNCFKNKIVDKNKNILAFISSGKEKNNINSK